MCASCAASSAESGQAVGKQQACEELVGDALDHDARHGADNLQLAELGQLSSHVVFHQQVRNLRGG